MNHTEKNRVRIEKVHHVIQPDNNTDDGCDSVGHDVDFWQIQSQNRQKQGCRQAKSRRSIPCEEMQQIPIHFSMRGKRTQVGK